MTDNSQPPQGTWPPSQPSQPAWGGQGQTWGTPAQSWGAQPPAPPQQAQQSYGQQGYGLFVGTSRSLNSSVSPLIDLWDAI